MQDEYQHSDLLRCQFIALRRTPLASDAGITGYQVEVHGTKSQQLPASCDRHVSTQVTFKPPCLTLDWCALAARWGALTIVCEVNSDQMQRNATQVGSQQEASDHGEGILVEVPSQSPSPLSVLAVLCLHKSKLQGKTFRMLRSFASIAAGRHPAGP